MPTLYEYYKSKGQNLPSLGDRAREYERLGLGKAADYAGEDTQNASLLASLQGSAPISSTTPPVSSAPRLYSIQADARWPAGGPPAPASTPPRAPAALPDVARQVQQYLTQKSTSPTVPTVPVREATVGLPPAPSAPVASAVPTFQEVIQLLRGGQSRPQTTSAVETYKTLRGETGVSVAESELEAARAEQSEFENRLFNEADLIKGKPTSSTIIQGKLQNLDAETSRAYRDIQEKVRRAQERVTTKTSTLDTLMKLTGQDYERTSREYEQQYTQNYQAFQVFNSMLTTARAERNEAADDASANLKTIMDQFTKKPGMAITPEMESAIGRLEVVSGLPQGFTKSFLAAKPEAKILHWATNNGVTQAFYEDPANPGQIGMVKTYGAGGGGAVGGTLGGVPSGIYQDAFRSASLGLSNQARLDAERQMTTLLQSGDVAGAKEYLVRVATAASPVDQQNQAIGRLQAIDSMRYIDEALELLRAEGVSTNLITGSVEKIAQKLGLTSDPRLAYVGNQIAQALQVYRRAMTGVAFNPGESEEYKKIFPNLTDISNLQDSKLQSLLDSFERNQRTFLSYTMGSSKYDQIFGSRASVPFGGQPPPAGQATGMSNQDFLNQIDTGGSAARGGPMVESLPGAVSAQARDRVGDFDYSGIFSFLKL